MTWTSVNWGGRSMTPLAISGGKMKPLPGSGTLYGQKNGLKYRFAISTLQYPPFKKCFKTGQTQCAFSCWHSHCATGCRKKKNSS